MSSQILLLNNNRTLWSRHCRKLNHSCRLGAPNKN